MTEQIITRKSGTYGRLQITIPMTVKTKMVEWSRNSGLKKSAFFRLALMIGVNELANQLNVKESTENLLS